MIKKIIKTLFSIRTAQQLHNFSNWLDNIHNNGNLNDSEYSVLQKMITPFGKHLLENLIAKQKLEDLTAKQKNEVVNKNIKQLNKEFVPFIEKLIFDYFATKHNNLRFCCVYDLPLNINLIEADILKQEIKIYLQRPGLFIGRAGKDMDTIQELICSKFDLPQCKIRLIETHGITEYNKW